MSDHFYYAMFFVVASALVIKLWEDSQ